LSFPRESESNLGIALRPKPAQDIERSCARRFAVKSRLPAMLGDKRIVGELRYSTQAWALEVNFNAPNVAAR
jgi:hypothetical protein